MQAAEQLVESAGLGAGLGAGLDWMELGRLGATWQDWAQCGDQNLLDWLLARAR